MQKRIFVGLSGGVDSAVSAALLKEQGYEVTGCFIKIWQPEFIECTWREDRLDAMRVASALGIPFREVDFSEEYKKEVVDTMIADYARGITPNPDVACNRSIKFGHFAQWARDNGADSIATGHYARIAQNQGKTLILRRGKDTEKDQSYFLWQLGEDELSNILFPIGEFTKQRVRSLAKKFELPNANKPDSQGLCFIGDVSMEDFLVRFMPLSLGSVVDLEGKRIGEHHGAALYTAGQRHGFTFRRIHAEKCPERARRVEGSVPHYVVSVDVLANTVRVSPRRSDAARKEIALEHVHWINSAPSLPLEADVQTRYRETPVRATITRTDANLSVAFANSHLVSPGQSLVMYESARCLGGGIIT